MYTETQIRAAGISGEISSIDVEHLINILKIENEVSDISAEGVKSLAEKIILKKANEGEKHGGVPLFNLFDIIDAMEEYASIANERKGINDEDLKMLKKIRDYFGENDAPIFNHTAFSVIDRIIKNTPVNERKGSVGVWISVDDRFPEIRVPVLVYMDYSKIDTCYWSGELWIQSVRAQHSNGSVTHWMPLPASPKSQPKKEAEDWQDLAYKELPITIQDAAVKQFLLWLESNNFLITHK